MINTLEMAQAVFLVRSMQQCIRLFVEERYFNSTLGVNIFFKNDDSCIPADVRFFPEPQIFLSQRLKTVSLTTN